MGMDYATMSRRELIEASDEARAELAKRQTEDVFRQQLADMQAQYCAAFGHPHEDGEKWEDQSYPLTAYCVGDIVTVGAAYYKSLLPGNQFSPDDRGWRLIDPEGNAKPWVQPKYDHDAYMRGERVTLGGFEFEAAEDHVMEKPTRQSTEWQRVEPDDDGE